MFKSIYLLVMDSVGVGAMPDAYKFGDEGADTFQHVIKNEDTLKIKTLLQLGMAQFTHLKYMYKPTAVYGKMKEKSVAKDTTTGHWEIAGLVTDKKLPTYPNGFPDRIINEFVRQTGRRVIGNKAASGTEIIRELGEEHVRSGDLIVYTSADSVFQIAAHESIVPLDALYDCCKKARKIMTGDDACSRIIARPFVGEDRNTYRRTAGRRDFSLAPFGETLLDMLLNEGIMTTAVGKINDIFCGKGITEAFGVHGNTECMDVVDDLMDKKREGLVFVNLVDFDMEYGHRNDKHGYFECLVQFNCRLEKMIEKIDDDTCIIITADHGCDPTDVSTDHTREYVPVIVYANNIQSNCIGIRNCFGDISATVLDLFGVSKYSNITKIEGKSFAEYIKFR